MRQIDQPELVMQEKTNSHMQASIFFYIQEYIIT